MINHIQSDTEVENDDNTSPGTHNESTEIPAKLNTSNNSADHNQISRKRQTRRPGYLDDYETSKDKKDEKSKSAVAETDRQTKSKETNVETTLKATKQMDWKKTRKRKKKVGLNMLGKRSILKMSNIFNLDINKCSNEFQLEAIQRAISLKQE